MDTIVPTREQTAVPIDNKCEICYTNDLRYYQREKHVCLYCWTRVEYPELVDKTDDEIKKMRTIREEEKKTASLVNMKSFMGFQTT